MAPITATHRAKTVVLKLECADEPEGLLKHNLGSSHCGSVVTILTSIHEVVGSIPGLTQWVKDLALP